jgi:Ni/Co efflux regulator RcnB
MKKFLLAAVALTILGSAGAAAAQPYDGGQRQDDRYERRDDRGDHRNDRRDDRYDRRDGRQDNRYERRASHRYNAGAYYAPRGYQHRNWRRGQYLPPAYRGRGYYVDYRAYRLPPPPRGYGYYRSGNDVILTAVATGLIASVVFDLFN